MGKLVNGRRDTCCNYEYASEDLCVTGNARAREQVSKTMRSPQPNSRCRIFGNRVSPTNGRFGKNKGGYGQ